jgi:hypothetical protein
MSTQAYKCPNLENGGKVNVQVSIQVWAIDTVVKIAGN